MRGKRCGYGHTKATFTLSRLYVIEHKYDAGFRLLPKWLASPESIFDSALP